ncbi:MAG: ribosomal protein L7/L12, partial [Ruminiclostridium sp.]|nr:ribosomal protein L7/L12 [Ruminiclostridium sp.]
PNFTADDFTAFAKNVYIDIQNAWCKRDLSEVRPVLHTNLYNTTQKQVQSKIDQKVIYHYESIAINTAYLTSFVRDEQYEYLTVYLNARFIDYQTSEETGAIIRGDKNTRWDFRYKMKFMRSVGMLTKDANADNGYGSGHNCPNCGAPLEISSSGKCAYCDSVVTTGMYSWVLSDFTTIRDDTKDDGIRVPTKVNNAGSGQTIRILSCPDFPEFKTQVAQVITGFTNLSLAEAEQVLNNLPQTITYRTEPKSVLDFNTAKQSLVNMGVEIEGHTNIASGAKVAVDLVFFPSTAKIQTIEVIRKHTGVGLKEAKDFTESMPCTIYEGPSDKANVLKADLDALGVDSRIRKL